MKSIIKYLTEEDGNDTSAITTSQVATYDTPLGKSKKKKSKKSKKKSKTNMFGRRYLEYIEGDKK